MSTQSEVQAALSRHDVQEAVRILAAAADSGDELAAFELGRWHMAGRIVERDLAAARAWFCRAAAEGHGQSRMIYAALLANGIGGARQWQESLRELDIAASDNARAAREAEMIRHMEIDNDGNPTRPAKAEPVTDSPAVYWVRSLFSAEECRSLIDIAAPFLQPSVIVDPATGQSRPHPIRTSEAASFPWMDETPFVHALNRRLAVASHTAVEQGEPLQVLRYYPEQQYRSHSDALPNTDNQRILTALVYLNEDFGGGETSFPAADLKLRGKTGDALVFRNTDPSGQADPRATHAGLPVTEGSKWLASRWIRERPFGR